MSLGRWVPKVVRSAYRGKKARAFQDLLFHAHSGPGRSDERYGAYFLHRSRGPDAGSRASDGRPDRGSAYGHLHTPYTAWIDGVRFEEVSLGYHNQWPNAAASTTICGSSGRLRTARFHWEAENRLFAVREVFWTTQNRPLTLPDRADIFLF